MRRPGIEPGSTAWKAAMLTTIPPTLDKNNFDYFFCQFLDEWHSTAHSMSARALSLGFLTLFLSCFDTLLHDVIIGMQCV